MAILPDANAFTRVAARPDTSVAHYAAGQVGEAQANFGNAVGQAGGHAANMFMLYQDQMAHTASNMAIVNLQRDENLLHVGQNGFMSAKLDINCLRNRMHFGARGLCAMRLWTWSA